MKFPKKSSNILFNESIIFVINLLLMVIITYFTFKNNINSLYEGMDGAYMMEIVRQQFQWGISQFGGSTSNFFQSLNNIYFPLNTSLVPALVLSSSFTKGIINAPLAYTLFAAEIFVVMYISFRCFKFDSLTSLLSAWVFILLAYPLIGDPKIYQILYLTPHISTGIAEVLLLYKTR